MRNQFEIAHPAARIQLRRLQWVGEVLFKPDQAPTRIVLASSPSAGWRCRRKERLKTWLDTVYEDMNQLALLMVDGTREYKVNQINIYWKLAAHHQVWEAAIMRSA